MRMHRDTVVLDFILNHKDQHGIYLDDLIVLFNHVGVARLSSRRTAIGYCRRLISDFGKDAKKYLWECKSKETGNRSFFITQEGIEVYLTGVSTRDKHIRFTMKVVDAIVDRLAYINAAEPWLKESLERWGKGALSTEGLKATLLIIK